MEFWNHITEIFGALAGLLYIYFEIKQRRLMWILGGISAIVYIYIFFRAGLYAAMAFQFYYIAVSIYGWRKWSEWNPAEDNGSIAIDSASIKRLVVGGESKITESAENTDEISEGTSKSVQLTVKMPMKIAVISIILILAATLIFWILLRQIDSDPMPFVDGFIVALSMVATFWVGNRYIEHWYLWFIANSFSVYMYISQALYPTVILYVVFLIASVIGYLKWRKFRRIMV